MSYSQNLDTKIQDFNASASTVKPITSTFSEVNHTRGGYIYKILNNLITSWPKNFALYLLKKPKVQRSFIQNSQCKSIAMVMVSLLTLPQQTGLNNNLMINNTMNFQNENSTQQAEHKELLKDTLDLRLELLNEVVNRCITTVDKQDAEDLHNNFCYVINNLFLREYGNKKEFIHHIIENYYSQLMVAFLESKAENLGNKLGQVVHSITDTVLNKADKLEIKVGAELVESISKNSGEMVRFIQKQSSTKRMGLSQRTYSSTQELNTISPKTYKIFEILNLILNQKSVEEPLIEEAVLEGSGIAENLFRFFSEHPLNNILHNVVTNFILSVGNSKFEKAKQEFVKNEGFFSLLDDITKNRGKRVFRQQKCYLGHLKKVANFFSATVLKSEDDKRWVDFRDEFLKEENDKENKALGDVYVNNENDDDGIMFCFTMQEIKDKYSVFLGFKTEEDEIKKIEEQNQNNEEGGNVANEAQEETDLLASEKEEKSLEANPENSEEPGKGGLNSRRENRRAGQGH